MSDQFITTPKFDQLIEIIEKKEIKKHPKIQQRDQVLAKLKELQINYPEGLRPVELGIQLSIPAPTVRRILKEYLKLGLVSMERINKNCSMYLALEEKN